jgi:DNA polymerase III delta subunit
MLYVVHAGDRVRGRTALHKLIAEVCGARAPLIRIVAEELNEHALLELMGAQGLFSEKLLVLLDEPFEAQGGRELILGQGKALAESKNVFFLFEGELDKKTESTLTRFAEKVVHVPGASSSGEAPAFNRFALTDALLKRDKKQLWVLFERARRDAVSLEELHGMLFWQIKSMLLALKAPSASGAGLKPFVFTKSRAGAKLYGEEGLQKLLDGLVTLYHESRRGRYDLGNALERWVLGV